MFCDENAADLETLAVSCWARCVVRKAYAIFYVDV